MYDNAKYKKILSMLTCNKKNCCVFDERSRALAILSVLTAAIVFVNIHLIVYLLVVF